jgi:hypothetical protein
VNIFTLNMIWGLRMVEIFFTTRGFDVTINYFYFDSINGCMLSKSQFSSQCLVFVNF